MSLVIARIIVSVMLSCLPIVIFVVRSRKPDNWMWMLFPMFGAVPAIVAALLLFVPIESLLDSQGQPQLKNVAVPLVGASVVFIFMLVTGIVGGGLQKMVRRLASGGRAAWGGIIVWSVLGALWGVVWRSTEWLAKMVGLANG